MRVKNFLSIMLIFMLVQLVPVAAQGCSAVGLTVNYSKVDDRGYAPRLVSGSQAHFDCIAGRDPNFNDVRLPSAWEAMNYWFGLVNPATGSTLGFLPVPTAD